MASYIPQDELDEEQAKRSIVVSNLCENISHKDVWIHFQRGSNGGGEVDSARYLDPNDPSVVVVTFESPETVETAIKQQQTIHGVEVDVQRYPAPLSIPEVFEEVQATVNPRIFTSSHMSTKVLQFLQNEFEVQYRHSRSRDADYLIGSFQQIELCHKHLLERYCLPRQNREASGRRTSRDDSMTFDPPREEIKKSNVYQTVPILLKFIFTKYSQQLQDIAQRYKIKISGENDGKSVKIESMKGCIQTQFDNGCDVFIDLYQKLHGGPMMLKEVILHLGQGSDYLSVDEAVNEIMHNVPVVIEKAATKDTWQFYGKEADVKSAIHTICKTLCIDNPLNTSSRKRVPDTSQSAKYQAPDSAPRDFPTVDKKEFPAPQASPQSPGSMDDRFSSNCSMKEVFQTKKGFTLTVQLSDITEERVDVIANCIDDYLTWFDSYGLANTIIDKGGQGIYHEALAQAKKTKMKPGDILVTTAGKLPCHKIMHIILWNGKKGKEGQKNIVQDGVLNCLRKVQSTKLKSVAFPAVGANQKTQMKLENCATAMVNAVEKYMMEGDPKKNAVCDIRFILYDQIAFEVFKQAMKRYNDCKVKPTVEQKDAHPSVSGTTVNSASDGRKGDVDTKIPDTKTKDDHDDCAICLDTPSDPISLPKCNHIFCKLCIEKAFHHKKQCPTCGTAYGVHTGNMPYGTMHYRPGYMSLPGYEKYGSIVIDYNFSGGIQGPEHPNPGQWYSGTSRTAYLPDCPEGREVLGLLRKAFDARLTFTIGTSVTTGQQNTVTWNDIHHKTNISGGATGFGYPDPDYLKRVKEELAAKGIS